MVGDSGSDNIRRDGADMMDWINDNAHMFLLVGASLLIISWALYMICYTVFGRRKRDKSNRIIR